MKRLAAAIVTLATVVVVGGCSLDPTTIPVPGTTVSGDTYDLDIEFANVLNLPPGAKVIANGIEVGNLDEMHVIDPTPGQTGGQDEGQVVARVRIKESVQLPKETRAELRQATPLGDVHIALEVPAEHGQAMLTSGSTIPQSQTAQSAQIEDTLAGLAAAVTGGAVTDIQNTVRQLNMVMPADPKDTARIFDQLKIDLVDVGADVESVDVLLDGLQANATTLLDDSDILDELLTDTGLEHTVDVIQTLVTVIFIFTGLGPVAHQILWLAPLVQSLDAAATAFIPMILGSRPIDLGSPSNLKKLIDLIQYQIIPFVQSGPKVNVAAATMPAAAPADMSPRDQTDRILDTLRMIGAVR